MINTFLIHQGNDHSSSPDVANGIKRPTHPVIWE